MPRVTQQKTRQALLVGGDPLDPNILPEKLQLFNADGDAVIIPVGHRREFEETTASLTESVGSDITTREAGGGESGVWELGIGVMLTHISVSQPCRVRFYTSEAKRDADVDRDRFTDPMDYPSSDSNPDHGCLSEFLLLTILSIDNIPADYLVSADGTADIPYRIDNYDLSAGAVTVTLTIKDVEQ